MTDPILTVAAMREAEQAAMDGGTSEWELMQRAGQGAAEWVARMAAGRAVTVLCGPGNNGGDGYVIADVLERMGLSVSVIAPVGPGSPAAQKAREIFAGPIAQDGAIATPVTVDCLFGYGLSRTVEAPFSKLLDALSASDCFKIAIDVPSAVESDTGRVLGPLPHYDLTIALGAWKKAHFLMPAMAAMGISRLVPIGLSATVGSAHLSAVPSFAAPAADAHKYRRGLLAVVVGAMAGAPLLAAEAAMRAGAGYVKLVSDHSHPDAPAELVIEGNGLANVLADKRLSAVLIGPGLGRTADARKRLAQVLESGIPAVLDADALRLLDRDLLAGAKPDRLCVTPHEGELDSLCEAFAVDARGKLDQARQLHDVTGMTILAKGPDTLLAGDGQMAVFPRGSSWLSVAGTGDVLAGIVASRLACHADPQRAAEEGVWLHHEAARIASPAFTAGDLARAVKLAMAAFL